MLRKYRPVFRDVVVLLAIPGALAALHFFLPGAMRSQLVFTYGDSGIVAAWTSAFLHVSNGHLYDNLFGYAIGAGFSYHLYTAHLQQRRRFWITVTILIIVTPIVTTAFDYGILYRHVGLIATGDVSQGFSGIASTLGGMLLTGIGLFVADEYDATTGVHTVLFIFLIAFGSLTVVNGIVTPMIAGLLTVGLGLLSTGYISRRDLRQPSRIRARLEKNAVNIALVAPYVTVACIFVYLILPIQVVQDGNFVNIFAHSVGFIVGIIGAAGVANYYD